MIAQPSLVSAAWSSAASCAHRQTHHRQIYIRSSRAFIHRSSYVVIYCVPLNCSITHIKIQFLSFFLFSWFLLLFINSNNLLYKLKGYFVVVVGVHHLEANEFIVTIMSREKNVVSIGVAAKHEE